jgi:hypothetical protein
MEELPRGATMCAVCAANAQIFKIRKTTQRWQLAGEPIVVHKPVYMAKWGSSEGHARQRVCCVMAAGGGSTHSSRSDTRSPIASGKLPLSSL